jgi:hypothetical protein
MDQNLKITNFSVDAGTFNVQDRVGSGGGNYQWNNVNIATAVTPVTFNLTETNSVLFIDNFTYSRNLVTVTLNTLTGNTGEFYFSNFRSANLHLGTNVTTTGGSLWLNGMSTPIGSIPNALGQMLINTNDEVHLNNIDLNPVPVVINIGTNIIACRRGEFNNCQLFGLVLGVLARNLILTNIQAA